jgi:hypothetical protein
MWYKFQRAGKRDGVFDRPARPAVHGKADFVAEDFLHGFDARDDLREAALGQPGRDPSGAARSVVRRTSRQAWRASSPDCGSPRPA